MLIEHQKNNKQKYFNNGYSPDERIISTKTHKSQSAIRNKGMTDCDLISVFVYGGRFYYIYCINGYQKRSGKQRAGYFITHFI